MVEQIPLGEFGVRGFLIEGVRVKNVVTGELREIPVTGFFVAIGHKPNTDIFKGWIDMDENGYIKTIPGTSKTNIEGVFACGDGWVCRGRGRFDWDVTVRKAIGVHVQWHRAVSSVKGRISLADQ